MRAILYVPKLEDAGISRYSGTATGQGVQKQTGARHRTMVLQSRPMDRPGLL